MKTTDSLILLILAGTLAMLTATAVILSDVSGSRQSFALQLFEIVSKALPFLSVKSRLLIVAHAAHESGWGQLGNGRKTSNNVFNLTAGPHWTGPTIGGTDTDANSKPIAQNWRVYPSLDAAVADYWTFLGSYYSKARSILWDAPFPDTYSRALKAGGYYEAPEASYSADLNTALIEVERLVGVSA